MNWITPTTEKHPPFKQIVLGFKKPNQVSLVKLAKIDETGLVFAKAESVEKEISSLVGALFSIETSIDIDMYAEIELPKNSEKSETSANEK